MRRDFLKLCGLAGLGLAVPFRLPTARAAEKKDEPYAGPYYVVFNAAGGWDTTYLMDPKGVNGINRLYTEGDIVTKGAHTFAPNKKHAQGGMSNEEFYAEFGGELLTFNGLDYSVNNHAPGDRYVLDRIEQALREEQLAQAASPRLPRAERGENMLYAAQASSKALQRVTQYIPAAVPKERLAQQAEIALASFKAGVCVSANLSIGQFDSHANNDPDQMKLIPEFLPGIAYLVRRARELKTRDQLVVVVQSEMGRTPNYN